MSDSFLETDEILQALVLELEKFKSSSEQLTLAEENTGDLLDACNELVELCKHLVERNKQQLDETVQLARDTEERHNLLIDAHQASTASTEEKLNSLAITLVTNEHVINGIVNTLDKHGKQLDTVENKLHKEFEPLLQRIQSTAGLTRVLIYILLLIGVVNGAAAIYLIRLLSS